MGTWGSGNLDSDGALDCVSERSDELVASIWESLRDADSAEADEYEYDELFVNLEWLFAVEGAGCFNGWGLPDVAELDPVLEGWLTAWSTYFDGLAGPEFKAERRRVIEATFGRFRKICAKYEAQRSDD